MATERTDAGRLPVVKNWFAARKVGDSVIRITEPYVHELIRANSFLVKGQDRDLLVDTGLGIASLMEFLRDSALLDKRLTAIATHAHFDHIGSMHEFAERLVHPTEADDMAAAADSGTLYASDFPKDFRDTVESLGMPLPDLLITAAPHQGFDPGRYGLLPAPPTAFLVEGDSLDLGSASYEVIHLPGHSPGGIGLYDPRAGVLFSGDAIYDGPLLDEALPGADVTAYCGTMRRLRELPVSQVHGGHYGSFGQERLIEIADAYLERRAGATLG